MNCLARTIFTVTILVTAASDSPGATFYVPDDFSSIQEAIDAAANGDKIIVRPGTYRAGNTINFLGKAIEVRSESGREVTLIDGYKYDSVVTFETNEASDSILHGFTIFGGNGKPNGFHDTFGGGIYCKGASPQITGNTIISNRATIGGGIYCTENAAPLILGNRIERNTADSGGGIFGERFTDPVIENNVFRDNTSDIQGAGIYLCCTSGRVVNNLICYNTIECPIPGVKSGAGIFCIGEPGPNITNCTIVKNDAGCAQGGGIGFEICTPPVTNCIIFDNRAEEDPQLCVSSSMVTFCNIQGGYPGEGNIDADPLFVLDYHLSQSPCQLWDHSPCVDAGDPASLLVEGATRSDGKPDIDVVDMGYHYTLLNPAPIYVVPDEYAAIQDAIKAAHPGGIVMVRPGRYRGLVSLYGEVTLVSEHGPQVTIIDANQERDGVVFENLGDDYTPILDGFTITNSSGYRNGISCHWEGTAVIRNCIVIDNWSNRGGGINIVGSNALIENTIIAGNGAESRGGGIYCSGNMQDPTVTIRNCTITENCTGGNAGAIYSYGTRLVISNSILWENNWPLKGEIHLYDSCTAIVNHSLIQGGPKHIHISPGCNLVWGPGMIDGDPLFIDPAAGDYRLSFDSPCRSAGNRDAPGMPATDFEGDPRPGLFTGPDIGADEFHTHLSLRGPVKPGEKAAIVITGWPGTSPVTLFTGSGLLDEPVLTSCGWLFLRPPWEQRVHLEALPDNGVRTVYRTVSPALVPGTLFRMQALVGTELTNLQIAVVR